MGRHIRDTKQTHDSLTHARAAPAASEQRARCFQDPKDDNNNIIIIMIDDDDRDRDRSLSLREETSLFLSFVVDTLD